MRYRPVSQNTRYTTLQSSLAHYNQLLSVKPSVKTKLSNQALILPNNHKYTKTIQQERLRDNNLLYFKLLRIREQPRSSLSQYEEQGKSRKCSLKSQFREKEKERERSKSNLRLLERLRSIKSGIGTGDQWRIHRKRCRDQVRMLRRSTEGEAMFESEVYNSFNELKNSDIKTKFKLVNDGTRFGEPIKVEIQCQLDPKKPPKKFRKRQGKRSRNVTEQNLFVQQEGEGVEEFQQLKTEP